MTDSDIRSVDIDCSAAFLCSGSDHSPAQWEVFAQASHGRTRDIYRRCGVITAAREDLAQL